MARLLTDADRALAQAYLDAMQKAMSNIAEFDPERVRGAVAAVNKAHHIGDSVREAFAAELVSQMAGPLHTVPDCQFLTHDAPWGSVLYRTSYGDDDAWERMLARITKDIHEAVDSHRDPNQLSMRHRLVVMDDQSGLTGAGSDQIRSHFNEWVIDELKRNWRPGTEYPSEQDHIAECLHQAGARYNFCLLVDDMCLESLDKMADPVVKIINRRWAPGGQDLEDEQGDEGNEACNLPWEGGVSQSEFEDVGWAYMHVSDYLETHRELKDADEWVEYYMRPPLMRLESAFDRAPGFWRRSRLSV